jgi:hypothetical protein
MGALRSATHGGLLPLNWRSNAAMRKGAPLPSFDATLLQRAYPQVLAHRVAHAIRHEIAKGCDPELVSQPVALEPAYDPISKLDELSRSAASLSWVPEAPTPGRELCRLCIWVSPEQRCNWNRSEMFVKQLSHLRHRAALEIIGNQKRITIQILCHAADAAWVRAPFLGQFERCTLSEAGPEALPVSIPPECWSDVAICDFYPLPPYTRRLTTYEELVRSPYTTLLVALSRIAAPALGFYQVVLAPVAPQHDWHHNIRTLVDLEFKLRQNSGVAPTQQIAQQAPSIALQQTAFELQQKAHNDKAVFAAALRVGVLAGAAQTEAQLRSLAVIASMFQHGGRPLNMLSTEHYEKHLSTEDIRRMFVEGLTYRPGFLVNSQELTSLVHIPPPEETEHLQPIMSRLETLPAADALEQGTPVGACHYADVLQPVCIPAVLRSKHTHAIGGTGTGKSTLLESMLLYDMTQGHGVALLDPHGTLVRRLLCLIPPDCAPRVIYLNPGDPEWVPIWNPLQCGVAMSRSRIADDLVSAFKGFFSGWGDRLEHLLRYAFLAILHLPDGSMLDVANLLRKKSPESQRLRDQVLQVIDNELALQFWRIDFDGYNQQDLSPPQHKLSKLLASETVGAMLSQGASAFSLSDVMDSGKILLVDLSTIGSEVRNILGCFILSLLHLAALGRNSGPGAVHHPFHIYCDEAHRFLTDAMEDVIAETRKFGVSLTLAHQYMSQFNTRKTDALSGVGSTIMFRVDRRDAEHLQKDLQGKVSLEDLSTLEVGQAIARIGNHIVRVRTQGPLAIPPQNSSDLIIARSRELYCRPTAEVFKAIRERRTRRERGGQTAAPARTHTSPAPLENDPPSPDHSKHATQEHASYDTF